MTKLSAIAKDQKQSKCPALGAWLNKDGTWECTAVVTQNEADINRCMHTDTYMHIDICWAQRLRIPLPRQEIQVWFLGQEDTL